MIRVQGRCPNGCGDTLFLGSGGYVTCSWAHCPDPCAVTRAMEGETTITGLVRRVHSWAQEKGWLDDRTFGDDIALMHSELSEALEEARDGRQPDEVYYRDEDGNVRRVASRADAAQMHLKPEGIPVELADVVIRIFQWAGKRGVNLEAVLLEKLAYNDGRPYRHGGRSL